MKEFYVPVVLRAIIIFLVLCILAFTFSGGTYLRVMALQWPQHVVGPILSLLLITGRILAGESAGTYSVSNAMVDEDDLGFFFLVLGGLSSLSAIRFTAGLLSGVISTLWFITAAFIWKQDSTLGAFETSITALLGSRAPHPRPSRGEHVTQQPRRRKPQRSWCLPTLPTCLSGRSATTS